MKSPSAPAHVAKPAAKTAEQARKARLAAALKANIARRKAQAAARADGEEQPDAKGGQG